MNDIKYAERYQCLPIRYSGRPISLHNEHSIIKHYTVKAYGGVSKELATFTFRVNE
jgi:hypothetical protein